MANGITPQNRLASLDQFRGYTMVGMLLVNYISHFAAAPFILRHHNTFCSYADTIMPQFFFAVGFSLRLSFGRRAHEQGLGRAYWHVIKRLIGLAIVAIVVYEAHPTLPKGSANEWASYKAVAHWDELNGLSGGNWWMQAALHVVTGLGHLLYEAWKNNWGQTLMHIAVTSLWILPVLRLGPMWRILYMAASALVHLELSRRFNFDWVNGYPAKWEPSGIDGGPLGFLTWSIPTILGTLACDVALSPRGVGGKSAQFFVWGAVLMAFAWLLTWGTRIYDVPEAKVQELADQKLSDHPVIPQKEAFNEWKAALLAGHWPRVRAEWPFVPPPHSEDPALDSDGRQKQDHQGNLKFDDNSAKYRKWNYWMMSQRCGTISYLTFSGGLSLAVFGFFYLLADVIGLRIGVFRTFGSNSLFTYVLADIVGDHLNNFAPRDAPAGISWMYFGIFLFLCWLIVRGLEKRKIYIKL